MRPSASPVQSTRGAAGAAVSDRTAPPKPQKGTRTREKARAARAKAKAWKAVCEAVRARDGGCRICRVWSVWMEYHHVIFRSQGGTDDTSNVVWLCRRCHNRVHARRVWISGDADPGGLLVIREAA